MIRLRRILFTLCMALAVVLGQQAVAMHDLAHVAGHKEGVPGKSACDKCFACAELSGAVGASIPPVALPDTTPLQASIDADAAVCAATHPAFRSRAPPAAP